ncbi:response regulator [Rhodocyclus tenuis]|uniref:DNA-binding NarL/FixJ family response regulator n=1 Tax=Rhodocyclus tenuis TaxID=1066 RepID=A0A840G693_RHOTE|nr:response regulator transcription factor [Rhodocyclus tenuis]MBB4247406.1 DNA-binding NarL/FixJ family response regulator [Rhodocyclus tenuis]MBK1681204.1 DNA-binding response regulator [Rhodocyclus tenuis]
MNIRAVLADDHQLVRAGVAALLRESGKVDVVGEAANAEEAISLVRELKPDLLLLDIAMPGMSGLEALALLNPEQPGLRVILLSMFASEEYVLRAFLQGAAGYLLKDSAPEELLLAVTAVMRGDIWLSAAISKLVVNGLLAPGGSLERNPALTSRQQQVLKLIASGKSTRAIGSELHLSVKTVETHRAQIMDKLDIHDLAGLVRYAIRQGMVPL